MIDDLGAADLGSYGHPYHRTPSMDALARDGLRFTRAYAAAPVCAPSRAALMTGKSPARLHLTHSLPPLPRPLAASPALERGPPVQKVTEPQSATWLAAGEVTIAERLRERGYRTALIGKWHLGRGPSAPQNQGFDVAVGGEEEAAPLSFFPPYGLSRLPDPAPGTGARAPRDSDYLTDRLTDEALAFLDTAAGEPFFLVLSHFAVHTPIEAPSDRVSAWSDEVPPLAGADREPEGSLRAGYAAMLESVDQSVGRVLAKLDDLGLGRDTLVIVTSDNGGVLETPEKGQLVTGNGALRGGKGTLYEGGLRVPLLVRWPAVVEAGRETDFVTGSTDWFPTLLQVAGLELSREGDGVDAVGGARLDGVSLLRVLRGRPPGVERSLHFHYPHYIAGWRRDLARETWWNTPGAAVRSGALKLIRRFDGAAELYDLESDPGELHDLSAQRPDDVQRLGGDLERWLAAEDAHLHRVNLAYDAGAFERSLEQSLAALGESSAWVPNGDCKQRLAGGKLVVDCKDTPFIMSPEMVARGPVRVVARFTTSGTGGAPALWYRSLAKPEFTGDRVDFEPAAHGVREGRIGHQGTILQLRLDFGRGKGGHAEVDWIRIDRDGGGGAPLVEWRFDRKEP